MTYITRNNEEQILHRVVDALVSAYGEVHVCYEDSRRASLVATSVTPFEEVVNEAFACDCCVLRVAGNWVYFIWGNGNDGWDAICDYTVGLDDVMEPIFEWIEANQ